jgi:hypothetical protein
VEFFSIMRDDGGRIRHTALRVSRRVKFARIIVLVGQECVPLQVSNQRGIASQTPTRPLAPGNAAQIPSQTAHPFKRFNSSPEVIRLVVMMYVRFPLSLRNVEDLLFERGIDLRHETVRM